MWNIKSIGPVGQLATIGLVGSICGRLGMVLADVSAIAA
jgi:hypothetical protein